MFKDKYFCMHKKMTKMCHLRFQIAKKNSFSNGQYNTANLFLVKLLKQIFFKKIRKKRNKKLEPSKADPT